MSKNLIIDMSETLGDGADHDLVIDEDAPVAATVEVDADVVDEDIDPADRLPSHAKRNSDGSVTLPLHYPQTIRTKKDNKVREKIFAELVLHRLNGADQRAISSASDEMMAVVAIARSTRLNQAIMNALFDRMDASDLTAAGQVLNHFLGSGQKTGK